MIAENAAAADAAAAQAILGVVEAADAADEISEIYFPTPPSGERQGLLTFVIPFNTP